MSDKNIQPAPKSPQDIDYRREYYFMIWAVTPYLAMLEAMVQNKFVDAEKFKIGHQLLTQAIARKLIIEKIDPYNHSA